MSVRKKLIVGNESNYIGPQSQYRYPRVSQSPKTSAQFTCVCFDPDAQYTIMITYTFSRQHAKYYHEFRKQIKACCHKSPMPPFVSSVAVCVNYHQGITKSNNAYR
jgi:hypothetical protein